MMSQIYGRVDDTEDGLEDQGGLMWLRTSGNEVKEYWGKYDETMKRLR